MWNCSQHANETQNKNSRHVLLVCFCSHKVQEGAFNKNTRLTKLVSFLWIVFLFPFFLICVWVIWPTESTHVSNFEHYSDNGPAYNIVQDARPTLRFTKISRQGSNHFPNLHILFLLSSTILYWKKGVTKLHSKQTCVMFQQNYYPLHKSTWAKGDYTAPRFVCVRCKHLTPLRPFPTLSPTSFVLPPPSLPSPHDPPRLLPNAIYLLSSVVAWKSFQLQRSSPHSST